MSLSVGIVGLPNVGKSTLFNALLEKQQALAANYPFATIEPNVGIVPVPDKHLPQLAEIVHSKQIVPATIEFVDIAGLVAGAAEGAGLGNKFLANIRETSFILHVVRAFTDSNIIKEGSVDPKSDYTTIATELQLADLATLEKQREPKGNMVNPENMARWNTIQKWQEILNAGQNIRSLELNEDQRAIAKELALLTAKAEIVALNVAETDLVNTETITQEYAQILEISPENIVVISAKLEEELASLSAEEKTEYLNELSIEQSGLERLIQKAYQTLGLQSFYTAGEKEVRAWTIHQNTTAPQAAGVIHTDFEKHFIKAKVCSFQDFVSLGGWKAVAEGGKLRQEGKDYTMRADDVVEFMIGK